MPTIYSNIVQLKKAVNKRIFDNTGNLVQATRDIAYTLEEIIDYFDVNGGGGGGSSFQSPLQFDSLTGIVSITQADTDTDGYLSFVDWDTFNGKQDALGYTPVNVTRLLNINGNSFDLSADRQWRTAQADTGLLSFNAPGLSVVSGTNIGIAPATGYVIDNETNPAAPVYTYVNYPGTASIVVPTTVGGPASYIMLGVGEVITFQNTFPTSAERKAKIWLGKVSHPAGVIVGAINEPDYITSPMSFSRDLFQAFGPYINSGIYPSSNGANTNMNISSGYIHGNGISFTGGVANRQDPNRLPNGAGTAVNFAPRTRSSAYTPVATNSIDCSLYDDGTGVGGAPVTIPGAVTRATIRYIYAVPTSTAVGYLVQYGQTWYNSLTDAISAVGRETQVILPNLPGNAILIGVLVARKDATQLNNLAQAQFFFADKVGQINGATAGISVGTMQSTYNNSVSPQITTTTALGGIYYQRGSTADTDIVFGIKNGAGTTTWSVTGAGVIGTANTYSGTNIFSVVQRFAQAGLSINDGISDKLALNSTVGNALILGSGFTSVSSAILTLSNVIQVPRVSGASAGALQIGQASNSVQTFSIGGGFNGTSYVTTGTGFSKAPLELITMSESGATAGDIAPIYIAPGTTNGAGKAGSVYFFTRTLQANIGGGNIFEGNMTAAPTANPTGGLFRWTEAGNFKIRTSAGALITLGAVSDFDDIRILDFDGITWRTALDTTGVTNQLRIGNGWGTTYVTSTLGLGITSKLMILDSTYKSAVNLVSTGILGIGTDFTEISLLKPITQFKSTSGGSKLIEADLAGNPSAIEEIVSYWIFNLTVQGLLSNAGNWTAKVYTGASLASYSLAMGMEFADANYRYSMIDSVTPIRTARV